jgi:hypothetical protein
MCAVGGRIIQCANVVAHLPTLAHTHTHTHTHTQVGVPCLPTAPGTSLGNFSAVDLTTGATIPLSKYAGQVVLIVNVATY